MLLAIRRLVLGVVVAVVPKVQIQIHSDIVVYILRCLLLLRSLCLQVLLLLLLLSCNLRNRHLAFCIEHTIWIHKSNLAITCLNRLLSNVSLD